MSRKGISPLVASVLLIAITMSIAGMLAYWASTYVSTALPGKNQTSQECNFMDFIIEDCKYDSSAGSLRIIVKNIRTVTINGLNLQIFYPNGTISPPIVLKDKISPGELKGFLLDQSQTNISSDFSKISLTSIECPDKSREDYCTRV